MYVTNLGTYDLILRYTYLRNHGIVVDPAMGKIWFRPNWCQHAGAPPSRRKTPKPADPTPSVAEIPVEIAPTVPMKILRRGKLPYTVIDKSQPTILNNVDICAISASNFRREYRRTPRANIFANIFQDIQEYRVKQAKSDLDPCQLLPVEYHDYADVFSKAASDRLPPHRPYDHHIRQAFHRIRMNEEDEDLTTFRTKFRLFKYRVMPFGLTNELASYQHFMNDVLFD